MHRRFAFVSVSLSRVVHPLKMLCFEELTFFFRHASQACWTCLRFTGSPPRLGSEATNLTLTEDDDMTT